MKILYFLSYPLLYFTSFIAHSQEHDLPPGDPKGGIKTKITEYSKELKTYDFNDPNPIPVLLNNPKIYPYFTFDGYQKEAENKSFKIIELENDYIKVFVTPELGGKVWGAIEKSTGEEFIYRNEVVKFRNISMRGPWTSGGIEFNFGIIGHHPSTATPVDYIIQKNDDGSVSCTVGNIDLPSRTQWRVKIIVRDNFASFFTKALWYNPSPVQQSYYNWMTAAAPARDDLEFYTPGNAYLEHSGKLKKWPIDYQGRDLSKYNQNNFGPSKSYHVVGDYNDFFGGYYRKDKYGYGHWGKYEDMPGQKLWLWSQSRSGGIWEDLLTDTDGQYIEFQAGRLFVQFSPGDDENPISQVSFEPYVSDQWLEAWFPLKEIGGLKDASQYGAMNVERISDTLEIKLNPFIDIKTDLEVIVDDKLYHSEKLKLKPMDVFNSKISLDKSKDFEIRIKDLDLHFISESSQKNISRPFSTNDELKSINTTQKLYQKAKEDISYREYEAAEKKLSEIILKDPYHLEARAELGELFFRKGQYDTGLKIVNEGLSIDTYNASLNYIAGIIYKAKNDNLNAKETLGWASRSIKYRSNALSQIGDIYLKEKKFNKAVSYAEKALNFNNNNIPALEILAIVYRKSINQDFYIDKLTQTFRMKKNEFKLHKKENKPHNIILDKIYEIDPLHHIIPFEKYLAEPNEINKKLVINSHRSELAYQTYLELAISYYNRGLIDEAITLLELGPNETINMIWESFLKKDRDKLKKTIESSSVDFIFPFRRETIKVLEWADSIISDWKTTYFLALNLWGKNRIKEAEKKLIKLRENPDKPIFYLTRALLLEKSQKRDPLEDLKRAYDLDSNNWRVARALTKNYLSKEKNMDALRIIKKAYNKNKSNYIIGMDYVKTLIQLEKYSSAISSLNNLHILPYEHAGEGRNLYTNAYFGAAIEAIDKSDYNGAIEFINNSKKWPEKLGVGKPYTTDDRVQDYLLYYCYSKKKNKNASNYLHKIINYSESNMDKKSILHWIGLMAIKKIKGNEESITFSKKLLNSNHGLSKETQWIIKNFFKNNKITEIEFGDNYKLIQKLMILE